MKKTIFSKSFFIFFSLVFLGLLIFPLHRSVAQDFPIRPISIMAPFAPGGNSDIIARSIAHAAEKDLGKPVVVINKAGGNGLIGALDVAKGNPDGYTIGLFQPHLIFPEAYEFFQKAPYTSKDLKAIARVVMTVGVVAVRADAPWNSFAEMVTYARKNPLKYGSHSEGTIANLMIRVVAKKEGISLTPLPIQSDSQILTALLGGHISMGTVTMPSIKAHLDAGTVKLLALLLDERIPIIPNVPTITECGYPLLFSSYVGLFAPNGTPDSIIKKLATTTKKVTGDPSFLQNMERLGALVKFEDTEKFLETIAKTRVRVEAIFKEYGYLK